MTATNTSIRTTHGEWLMLATVGHLTLTTDVSEEFRLGRVTFITPQRFRRVCPRFGISKEHYGKSVVLQKLLEGHDSLALLPYSGTPDDIQDSCLNQIRKELDILSASQLYVRPRKQMARLGLAGESLRGTNTHVLLNKGNPSFTASQTLVSGANTLRLNKPWKELQRKTGYQNLLKIAQDKSSLQQKWGATLLRAAQMVGKGINCYDLSSAFVWNMVALEVLLAVQQDTYSKVLPKRVEALIGWISEWKTEHLKERLQEAYGLRCRVVHDGQQEAVTVEDVAFTDFILFNVLSNLLRHPRLFVSKDCLIQFSEMVFAEHLLGGRRNVRPKTLFYARLRKQ
jgi:hypothetical protein